jgi:hypothetical protein
MVDARASGDFSSSGGITITDGGGCGGLLLPVRMKGALGTFDNTDWKERRLSPPLLPSGTALLLPALGVVVGFPSKPAASSIAEVDAPPANNEWVERNLCGNWIVAVGMTKFVPSSRGANRDVAATADGCCVEDKLC